MRKSYRLPSQTYVSNGQLVIPLTGLESHRRVTGMLIRANLTIVQATSAAITGRVLYQIFEGISLEGAIRSTGVALRHLGLLQRGKVGDAPYQVAAADATYRRAVQLYISFEDQGKNPSDTCPRTEHLKDTPLTIKLAAQTVYHATGATVTGTIEVIVDTEDINPNVMPAQVEMGYFDGNQSMELPVGQGRVFTELFLYEETPTTAITSLTVVDASLRVDGQTVYDRMTIGELVAFYNFKIAEGGGLHTESESAPVQGESIPDEPAAAGAAAATVTVTGEPVPLYLAGPGYQVTKQGLLALRSASLAFSGTDTSLRVAWRARRPHTPSSLNAMRLKSGLSGGFAPLQGGQNVAAKTTSKVPLNMRDPNRAVYAQFMPVRLGKVA